MKHTKYFFPESSFGGFTDQDGAIIFFSRLNALLKTSDTVVDVGCGRGAVQIDPCDFRRDLRILKGKVAKVIGLDVDAAGTENPFIDEFRLIEEKRWPLEDAACDLVLADYVLEHLEHPSDFFEEVHRILKPGGYFCFRTSNKWNYISLAARMIPNRLHSAVVTKVQSGREEQDTFPTYFRCNSPGRLRRQLNKIGFQSAVYGFETDPRYLEFSRIAYWLGAMHQKFAPKFLKACLFGFCQKNG